MKYITSIQVLSYIYLKEPRVCQIVKKSSELQIYDQEEIIDMYHDQAPDVCVN